MTSRHSLGLGLLLSGFVLALGSGCSSSSSSSSTTGGSSTTTATGTGGGTTTSTTSTTNTTTTTTQTGAGGGTGGGGTGGAGGGAGDNHDFAGAIPVDVNAANGTAATLVDAMTKDFYKFSGKKGDRLTFVARAQSLVQGGTGDDNTIVDTVVTVYDSKQQPIAQDDDAWPRFGRDAQLFTILPEDGDYYVSVEDCNSALGPNHCAPADGIQTFDYELDIYTTDKLAAPEAWAGSGQDGTPAKAVEVTYKVPQGGKAGAYGISIIDGSFGAKGETHVFSFTPPKDATVDASQRPHAELWVQPISSTNGDGSTSNVNVWVVDSANANTVIAKVQQKNYSDGDNASNGPIAMSVPVTLGNTYYLYVQSDAAQSNPTTDFYFAETYVGSFYYGTAEASPDANDDIAKAEALSTPANVDPGSYFIDGDISKAGTDVDNYEMEVPADADQVSLYCSAERAGSGLRGFTASILGADMKTVITTGTEAADADFAEAGKSITAGANAKAYLVVKADQQDAAVAGTYYHCSVFFNKKQ
jgi:hypothetical protein